MLEELKVLKNEYYKKHGIQPNALILGRENFTKLLKDKKEFKAVILTESLDSIEELDILQVCNSKMFKVGHVE